MPALLHEKTAPGVQFEDRPKGERTRQRLLDLAYEAFIAKGFAATSVEELVEGAGITKSGFFYHFKDKHDLAREVLKRYCQDNEALLDQVTARARQLSDDPLHAFLIFLRLYAEELTGHLERTPGCLVATIAYQERSFAHDVRAANVEMVSAWRRRFHSWLEEIVSAYRPNVEVDVDLLADAGWSAVFGAFTLAKTTGPDAVVGRQILLYREMIRRYFTEGDRPVAGPRF